MRSIVDIVLRWASGANEYVHSRDEYPFDERNKGIHVFPCAILAETSTNCASGLAIEDALTIPANVTGRIVPQHICARQGDRGLARTGVAETTSSKLDGRTVEAGKPRNFVVPDRRAVTTAYVERNGWAWIAIILARETSPLAIELDDWLSILMDQYSQTTYELGSQTGRMVRNLHRDEQE